MNILYLTPLMKIGGEELSTLTLVREMKKRGHTVVVKGNRGPMTPEFEKTGAAVHISPRPYRRSIAGLLHDAVDVARLVRQNDINIVHVQSVLPAVSAAIAVKCLPRAERPALIFHERGISSLAYRIVPRVFNHLVDRVITNSDHELKILLANGLKVPCVRVHNCNNAEAPRRGADDIRSELGIARDARVFGIVGRLTHEKGHSTLIEAFHRVLEATGRKDLFLLIVGDGPFRGLIEKKIAALSLQRRVILAGFRRDMDRIYPAFDVLVVPSTFETFGNVAVEASAWGVPVIASEVGGLPEAIMHGESGVLFPPGDAGALAAAMQRLLDDPGEAARLGRRGEELASTYFTANRVADEVEAVYGSLMEDALAGDGAGKVQRGAA